MNNCIIYGIFINGSESPFYIGQTTNIARRIKDHRKDVENGSTLYVHKKMRKYDCSIYPLVSCLDRAFLDEYESRMIEQCRTFAGLREGGTNLTTGEIRKQFSPDVIKRLSEISRITSTGVAKSEITKYKISQSLKNKMTGEKNSFFGRKHSAETLAKISKSQKERHAKKKMNIDFIVGGN